MSIWTFSRGAELIESLRKKQVKIQAQREEEILQKIKQKMDRIKANQQKLQPSMIGPKDHYDGKYCVCSRNSGIKYCNFVKNNCDRCEYVCVWNRLY